MGTMTVEQTAHRARVYHELRDAGLGWLSRYRFSPRYLHRFIHPDEHIIKAASGRYRVTERSAAMDAGILVATNQRVLFLDRSPGYIRMNEIPYDGITGLETAGAGLFGSITLLTEEGVFTMLYVLNSRRQQFVDYVEKRRLGNEQM